MLNDDFVVNGSGKGELIKNYFALCIYRLAILAVKAGYIPKSWINLNLDLGAAYSKAVIELISKNLIAETQQKPVKAIREPMCIKTVITAAEKLLVKNAKNIANINLDS
jgi:hypothetical protein